MKSDFPSKLSPFSSLFFHIYFPYGLFPILSFFLLFCSSIVLFFKINFWEASFWNPWTQGGQRAMCMRPQLCPTLCDPMDHSLPGSSLCSSLQVRILGLPTGVGCHYLLQGIFLTQRLNPCLLHLLHCGQIPFCWVMGKSPRWARHFINRLLGILEIL